MKIHLHEITDHETELDLTQDEPWVLDAVKAVDEVVTEAPSQGAHARAQPRAIRVHMSLRKVDDVVVLLGETETSIKLLCSRCANPFLMKTQPKFSALFCRDPEMAGIAHLKEKRPAGQNKGFARHAHDDTESTSSLQDIDITYLADDYIDLKEALKEQLQLQVPFQPLCKEDCNGICPNCGADLNVGRCACSKVVRSSPFAVLSDMKVYAKSDS